VRAERTWDTPSLLPPELLESDDDEEEAPSVRTPKRTRLDAVERMSRQERRLPRDEQVGSTVYRVVAESGDKSLAPKAQRESLYIKERLLARHRVPERASGFFARS
jgi:U3 small nucleolar RNA-associated protein 16